MPDKRDFFARFHGEGDISENVVVIVIGEPDVAELNLAFQCFGGFTLLRGGSDTRLRIQ